MKNIFKKTFRSVLVLGISVFFIISMFIPAFNVKANDKTITLTFDASKSRVSLGTRDGEHNSVEVIGIVDGNPYPIGFENSSDLSKLYPTSMNCIEEAEKPVTSCTYTFTIPEDDGINIVTSGDSLFRISPDNRTSNVKQNESYEIYDSEARQNFNGSAYLIWSCGSDQKKVCMHHFTNIEAIDGGMYIDANTITDDLGSSEKFNVHADLKGFADDQSYGNWINAYKTYKNISESENVDFSKVDPEMIIGDPVDMREWEDKAIKAGVCKPEDYPSEEDFHGCVDQYLASNGGFNTRAQLRPVNEPYLENAYVSYGDRQFKVIIYNNDYKALSIGSLEDLKYYPGEWSNQLTRQDSYDISDTTKEKPAEINTIILEDKVNLKGLNYNGLEVKSMEPLDVPSDAVTVTKNNDGSFKLVFASNFYDNVVFKVTDTNNKVYFIKVNRIALNGKLEHKGENKILIKSEFSFDNKTKYSDYIISATILYKDGTRKIVEMKNSKYVDDGLGNSVYDYEVDEENPPRQEWAHGKGLKRSTYEYEITEEDAKKMDKIYITAEKKGSTNTTYAGAFAGSEKGVTIDLSDYYREEA